KQEMSHKQVMSYLIGGGDYYCSYTFKPVKWGDIDRFLARQEKEFGLTVPLLEQGTATMAMEVDVPAMSTEVDSSKQPGDSNSDDDEESDDENPGTAQEEVTLVVSEDDVGLSTHAMDYPCRSRESQIDSLSLWE
ncbi:hypothetical protein DFH08DRAFT_621177, partial [Mycena albidolilacea]